MEKGYVQVYTGNGKGKTTASFGMILRAASAGMNVYVGQFVKNEEYNEIKTLKSRFPEVTVEQYGNGCFIRGTAAASDQESALRGYEKAYLALTSGSYDLVILDEINVALYFGLLTTEEALHLISAKPPRTELIFTGRYAPDAIKEAADLVSEIHEVKHYYSKGVMARAGIEM